jgi:YVTN family beta-propeller protein
MKKTILGVAALSLLACTKVNEPLPVPGAAYNTGVFINNEGAFSSGEATLSHYDPSSKTVTATAFFDKNNYTLSDLFQSLTLANGKAYMVIDNANVIEVANASDLESEGQITGINGPRFMAVDGSMGYVSSWGDDAVKIVDLNSKTVTGSIAVGSDPEAMVINDGKLYVANSGWSAYYPALPDSSVSVIDLATNTEIQKINVGHVPNSLKLDANGDLWVLCSGIDVFQDEPNSTLGKLVKVDLSDYSTTVLEFPTKALHPAKLQINGAQDVLYYLGGAYGGNIYKMSINATSVSTTPFITNSFYGVGVDPSNGDVYGGTPNFSQNAKMYRYDRMGALIDSAEVGIAPNGFTFIE